MYFYNSLDSCCPYRSGLCNLHVPRNQSCQLCKAHPGYSLGNREAVLVSKTGDYLRIAIIHT